jgi:hypothetical protein
MKIVENIFNAVFSFAGFMTIAGALFILGITLMIKDENADRALAEATTKACYDSGLIKVDTDAGFYCVAPTNLVKVEVKS